MWYVRITFISTLIGPTEYSEQSFLVEGRNKDHALSKVRDSITLIDKKISSFIVQNWDDRIVPLTRETSVTHSW